MPATGSGERFPCLRILHAGVTCVKWIPHIQEFGAAEIPPGRSICARRVQAIVHSSPVSTISTKSRPQFLTSFGQRHRNQHQQSYQ